MPSRDQPHFAEWPQSLAPPSQGSEASFAQARAYGATCTPHVFLLDQDRKVVYMGAVDDNQQPDKVTKHHLREAIDAALAGTSAATTETKQFGCGINYKSKAQ